MKLLGHQRKYLRSLAHHLKPKVVIGKHGINDGCISSIKDAFNTDEIIKIKIHENKNVDKQISYITDEVKCNIVGHIGKILIFYKENKTKELRKIILPIK